MIYIIMGRVNGVNNSSCRDSSARVRLVVDVRVRPKEMEACVEIVVIMKKKLKW